VLIELSIVNESDTPVTVDRFELVLFHEREVIPTTQLNDLSTFRLCFEDEKRQGGFTVKKDRRVELDDLKHSLKGVALTKGIGHSGWLRFEVKEFDRKKMETARVKLRIVDAFEIKHKVLVRKKHLLDSTGELLDLSDLG
jgi:hypothetical protein